MGDDIIAEISVGVVGSDAAVAEHHGTAVTNPVPEGGHRLPGEIRRSAEATDVAYRPEEEFFR